MPSTTARTDDSRISASLNAGITTLTASAVVGACSSCSASATLGPRLLLTAASTSGPLLARANIRRTPGLRGCAWLPSGVLEATVVERERRGDGLTMYVGVADPALVILQREPAEAVDHVRVLAQRRADVER